MANGVCAFGLLRNSFRPTADMRAVRSIMRLRADLIEDRSAHIQHMQKAMSQMNVRLSPTVSDITGVTGMGIMRAITAGERDPHTLAKFRRGGCAKSEEEFIRALTGNYRDEHVFGLQRALNMYDAYTQQIIACDKELELKFSAVKPIHDDQLPPLEKSIKKNTHSKNTTTYDGRTTLYNLLGVDLVAVDGLNEVTAQVIISEIGTDMSRWVNMAHFCSWLSLAPHNEVTGGRIISRRTLRTRSRAGQAFRLAAQSVARTDTAFGAFFRRMRARKGPSEAIVATAHKIARVVYTMIRDRTPYHRITASEVNLGERERAIARLIKKAKEFGLTLEPSPVCLV